MRCSTHCGIGTSALMANLHAKGVLKKGQQVENFSILGTKFVGKVLDESVIKGTTTAADKKTIKTRRGTTICEKPRKGDNAKMHRRGGQRQQGG